MKRNRWLALTSLAWALTACSQSEDPAQTKAALVEPQEPTYESIPKPSQLMEILGDNLSNPVDTPEEEEAIALFRQELEGFKYVPSSEMVLPEEEEPVGASFAEDVRTLESYLAKYSGGAVVMSCGVPPCIHYGDFDGDGLKDRVAQVRGSEEQFGLFFLLASGKSALLGAGVKSGIGSDLLWMLSWERVVRDPKYPVTELVLRGAPEEALIHLGVGTDGTVEVQATWLTPPKTMQ